MSASALFELDTLSRVCTIFDELVESWKHGRQDRNVSIWGRFDPTIRFDTTTQTAAGINAFVDDLEVRTGKNIEQFERELLQKFPEIRTDTGMNPESVLMSVKPTKELICELSFFFGRQEDKDDLLAAVAILAKHSLGDIYYFRGPSAFADFYQCNIMPTPDTVIHYSEILKYPPDMSAWGRYVLQK